MKKLLLILLIGLDINGYAQSFNDDKIVFGNFIKRMYISTPFEGVKIVDDYDHQYLVSVLSLNKANYTNQSVMNRVAQVKAQSQANTFLNGASISMDMVVKTTEKKSNDSLNTLVETIESIKQNSMGFVNQMELLINFTIDSDNRMLFIFYKELKKY